MNNFPNTKINMDINIVGHDGKEYGLIEEVYETHHSELLGEQLFIDVTKEYAEYKEHIKQRLKMIGLPVITQESLFVNLITSS